MTFRVASKCIFERVSIKHFRWGAPPIGANLNSRQSASSGADTVRHLSGSPLNSSDPSQRPETQSDTKTKRRKDEFKHTLLPSMSFAQRIVPVVACIAAGVFGG